MRDKFRKAVYEILGGSFVDMNQLIWAAYRDNLRDINPDDMPENCRTAFIYIKEILEKKLEDSIANSMKDGWQHNKLTEDEKAVKVREDAIAAKGYRHSPLNGMSSQKIRLAIFEIYDKLPRRAKASKYAKVTKG